MRKAWVYKITNPKGKIYVGSTVNIKDRVCRYKNLRCKAQPKIYNSLKKYGFENHVIEIICECTINDMYAKESYYGALHNVLSKDGLNLMLPKGGDKFETVSEERRANMRARMLGKKISEETRAKQRGKIRTPETIEKLRQSHLGFKRSEESINKNRVYWTGRKHTDEARANMRIAQKNHRIPEHALLKAYEVTGKKVINIETGVTFRSIGEAAKSINKQGAALSVFLNEKRPNKTPFRFV